MSSSQLTNSGSTTNQTIFQIPIGQDHHWHCGFCRRVHTICLGSTERREKGCRSHDPQEWHLHRGYDRLVQVFLQRLRAAMPRYDRASFWRIVTDFSWILLPRNSKSDEGRRPGAGHNPWPVATSGGLGGSLQCDL